MEETLHLYHAWLGYLLERLGQETVRVSVRDIRQALEGLAVSASREGEMYVITLLRRGNRDPVTDSRSENGVVDAGSEQREAGSLSSPQAKEVGDSYVG